MDVIITRWTVGTPPHSGVCMTCGYYFCVFDMYHDGPCICHQCQVPCG